jgi:hypothetical protein
VAIGAIAFAICHLPFVICDLPFAIRGLEVGGEYCWIVAGVLIGMVLLGVVGWRVGIRTLALTVGSPSVDRRDGVVVLLRSFGQSVVRLLCWCVQLGLVLWALNAVEGGMCNVEGAQILDLMLLTPVYYLLVTITPNVPIAEVGVRGAWAIAVFGTMNAALAGVLLWGINTLLPCVVWLGMKIESKK